MKYDYKFQVTVTAVDINIAVLLDVTSLIWVGNYQHFRRTDCPTLNMKAVFSSENLAALCQITQCHSTVDNNLLTTPGFSWVKKI